MKKLLLLAAALLVCAAASAQWSVSTVAGVNISGITDLPDDSDLAPKTGLYVGFGTAWKISPAFGLKAEMLYSRQGFSRVRDDFEGISNAPDKLRTKLRLNYLTMPVMMRLAIPSWDRIGIELGGQAGYLLGAWSFQKEIYKKDGHIGKSVNKMRQKLDNDDYNRFDYGLTGGLFFQMGRNAVFSVRYYYGLQEIIKNADSQNRVISIGLTQKF